MKRVIFAGAMIVHLHDSALAAGAYEFCVTRVGASTTAFGVRYKVGDIDPGKEALRVLVSQSYKQADTKSISVSDYKREECGDIREEKHVKLSAEQASRLAAAVGRGDVTAVAVIAAELATGITTGIVDGVTSFGRWLGGRIGIKF